MALILKAELNGASLDCKLETPEIINAFWADSSNKEVTLPKYDDNNVKVIIETNQAAFGKVIILEIIAKNYLTQKKTTIYSKMYRLVKSKYHSIPITISGEMFQEGKNIIQIDNDGNYKLIQNWYIRITLKGVSKTYCDSIDKSLRIHYIRFIPLIIESKKWEKALLFQKIWFEGDGNDKAWENDPYTELSIDWVLKFDRMKSEFEKFPDKFKTENAIIELRKQLHKMIKDGLIKLPDLNESCKFGCSDPTIITAYNAHMKVNERMPKFENYYYQTIAYKIDLIEPIDDCLAALASCQYRAIAFGEIYNIDNKYKVLINKIGVYIKDSFDFNQNYERLGSWSIINKDISKADARPSYHRITNKNYRDWRNDYKKGGDFNIYSTIKYVNYNHYFWL